jgi:hypothetical protein
MDRICSQDLHNFRKERRPLTFWEQMGSSLFSFRSNTCTFPSSVVAANTVDEYGAQAMSPTCEMG